MKISSCLRMLHTKIDFKNQSSFLNWFSGFTDDSLSLKKNYSSLNLVNNNKQSLVVWGTNLSSQVGIGRFILEKYKNLSFSPLALVDILKLF